MTQIAKTFNQTETTGIKRQKDKVGSGDRDPIKFLLGYITLYNMTIN